MTPPIKHGSTSTQNTQGTTADEINSATSRQEEKSQSQPYVTVERQRTNVSDDRTHVAAAVGDDPFGSEEGAQIQYKSMEWWYVPSDSARIDDCRH